MHIPWNLIIKCKREQNQQKIKVYKLDDVKQNGQENKYLVHRKVMSDCYNGSMCYITAHESSCIHTLSFEFVSKSQTNFKQHS